MKDFLKSIGLVQDFTIRLNCPKSYFIRELEQNIDSPGFELFESWSSGRPFKGEISGDTFSIRKRRKMFDPQRMMIVRLKGTVTSHDGRSLMNVETNVNSTIFYILGVFTFFFAFGTYVKINNGLFLSSFILPVFGLQVIFLLLIFYIALRRAVGVVKRETEKEFLWIIRNHVPGSD